VNPHHDGARLRGRLAPVEVQLQRPGADPRELDVAVDLRKSSSTFGHWVGVHLSAENKKQVWVPEGFAHGFVVLSETAEFLYKTTDYYSPEFERCIAWNDAYLNIDWHLSAPPSLSTKDQLGLSWSLAESFS